MMSGVSRLVILLACLGGVVALDGCSNRSGGLSGPYVGGGGGGTIGH